MPSITNNISLEVALLISLDIFSNPMSLFEHCLCLAKLLKDLGSGFDSRAGNTYSDEEAESGVACFTNNVCFTNNTCYSDTCPPLRSGHENVHSMYDENQTSGFSNIQVLA